MFLLKRYRVEILKACLLLFLLVPSAWCASTPAVNDFLAKLNLRYYCLGREGVTSFECVLNPTIPQGVLQRFKETLKRDQVPKPEACVYVLQKTKYVLRVKEGQAEVLMGEPPPMGNELEDKAVRHEGLLFSNFYRQVIQDWVSNSMSPIFSDEDFTTRTFRVQKTAKGFDISGADKNLSAKFTFDADGKLSNISGVIKDVPFNLRTGYVPSTRGFVLRSLETKASDFHYQCAIDYGVVGNYYLPNKWTFDCLIPGVMTEADQFVLEFSQFQLNPSHDDTRIAVNVIGKVIEPTYHYDFSTNQIETVDKKWIPSRNKSEPGLTQILYFFGNQSRYEYHTSPGTSTIRFWVTEINVRFDIPKMDVFISSVYPRDSCPYKVIVDHENEHVSICKTTFEKYKAKIQVGLETDPDLPTAAKPWVVQSEREGKARLNQAIDNGLNRLGKAFWAEVSLKNATIDLMENYKRLQAKCVQW